MTISIHDNLLVSYEVFCEQREIRFHTEFRNQHRVERVDVIFTGVQAYYFEHDNFGNIIHDITEVLPEDILTDERARFAEGGRYGWPAWKGGAQSASVYCREHSIHGYVLSSSYGMSGWILAQNMEKILRG